MFITCCVSPGFRDESKASWEYTANIIFFYFGEAIFFYDFAYCMHETGQLPEIICFPIKSFSYSAIMTCIVWLNCKTNWIWYAGYHTLYTLSRTIFEYFLRQMKSTFWSTDAILNRSYSILWTHGQCVFLFISKFKELPFLLFLK